MMNERLKVPISHIEHLIAVRIMASSIGICADPLQQLVISDCSDEIESTSSNDRILVSTETTHVYLSVVQ